MERNKENSKICKMLAQRFEVCKFYDRLTPDGVATIAGTILTQCRTPNQAELLVDAWIVENESIPTPADIARIAREMNRAADALPPPCEHCQDIPGYVHVTCTVKTGVFAGETRTALALCSCPRGEAIGKAAKVRQESERGPE